MNMKSHKKHHKHHHKSQHKSHSESESHEVDYYAGRIVPDADQSVRHWTRKAAAPKGVFV